MTNSKTVTALPFLLLGIALIETLPARADESTPRETGLKLSARDGTYSPVTETTAEATYTSVKRTMEHSLYGTVVREERPIGENNLQRVKPGFNERYRPVLDAIGHIMPMGCTGTHLGGGIVLTAQHCLSRTPGTMKEGMCDDVEVEWGYRFGVMPYLTSRCIKVVDGEYSKDRDYAFILVQPAPPATVEVETGQRPMKERRLTIFGHPQGRPLEWSGTCVLHLGTEGKFLSQYFFSHQCDTEPGSSGSAVLDDETLRIVGVHDGGEIFDTRNGKPWGWNYATYLVDTPVRSVLPGARPQETVPEGLPPSSPAIEGVGAGIPRQGINNP